MPALTYSPMNLNYYYYGDTANGIMADTNARIFRNNNIISWYQKNYTDRQLN